MATTEENRAKGSVFAQAYKRAQRALSSGFYLEAIIICDSLMTDRLRLVMESNHEVPTDRATTGSIVNFLLGKKVTSFDDNLWNDILQWSRRRNKQAHEMGNISGESLIPWRTRLAEAKLVAQSGFSLVNRVSKESGRHRL